MTASVSSPLMSALIVENDPVMQKLVLNYLGELGVTDLVCCGSSREAIEHLQARSFSLFVCDWKLKNPSTEEVYGALRDDDRLAHLPLIFVAGSLTKHDMTIASMDSRCTFALKPFSKEVFYDAVEEVIGHKVTAITKFNLQILKGEKAAKGRGLAVFQGEGAGSAGTHQQGEGALSGHQGQVLRGEGGQGLLAKQERPVSGSGWTTRQGIGDQLAKDLGVQVSPEVGLGSLRPEDISRRVLHKLEHKNIAPKIPASAIVVDGDGATTSMVKNYLSSLGSKQVDVVATGERAWAAIEGHPYDLVIMNWNLKGLNGLALYNRIRSRQGTTKIPLVVMSGSIQKDSFRILEESPATQFIKLPFTVELFQETLESTLSAVQFDEVMTKVIEEEIAPIVGEEEAVLGFVSQVKENMKKPFPVVMETAHLLSREKIYSTAEKVLKKALEIDRTSILALSELAKVCHRTGRSNDAMKLLAHADQFCPGNIERLCLMGEVGLTLSDTASARKYFTKVLTIDEENKKAKSGMVIAKNMEEQTDIASPKGPLHLHLASTLNVMGVTYVKNNQFDKGVEQYEAAMCFVNDSETVAKLQFNLGLAYLRRKDEATAGKWFQKAHENAGENFDKPKKYLEKMGIVPLERTSAVAEKAKRERKPSDGGVLQYNWGKK